MVKILLYRDGHNCIALAQIGKNIWYGDHSYRGHQRVSRYEATVRALAQGFYDHKTPGRFALGMSEPAELGFKNYVCWCVKHLDARHIDNLDPKNPARSELRCIQSVHQLLAIVKVRVEYHNWRETSIRRTMQAFPFLHSIFPLEIRSLAYHIEILSPWAQFSWTCMVYEGIFGGGYHEEECQSHPNEPNPRAMGKSSAVDLDSLHCNGPEPSKSRLLEDNEARVTALGQETSCPQGSEVVRRRAKV